MIVAEKPSASNLWGFGTRDWVRGILDPKQIAGPHYFGNTALQRRRHGHVRPRQHRQEAQRAEGRRAGRVQSKIEDVTLALATEAGRSVGKVADLDKRVAAGREAIVKEFACIDCHKFRDEGELGSARI